MKTIRSGIHQLATRSSRKARIASSSVLAPSRRTTNAAGRSCHFTCLSPTTVASATSGLAMIAFSRSIDEIHSPPDLITSLARSVIRI